MLLLACIASGPVTKTGQSESAVSESVSESPQESLPSQDDTGAQEDSPQDSPEDTSPPVDDGELRGVWVDRWSYASPEDVERIIAGAAGAGFNTVFFQIRGNGDAYYQSQYEPWASRLSGTLGDDPGWDPLQLAIDEAHRQGVELHAYINAFPFWAGTTPPTESTPRHAYLEHPEWLVVDDGGEPMALNSSYVWMSPGNPEVRQRLMDVVQDIVDHYEVDGIHLDLVRYPGSQYSYDEASLAAFPGGDYAEWQRQQVVEAVRGVYAVSPVPVTAAVWGIYENDWGWSSVSEGNGDYYQDSRAFLSEGVLDANAPMIYWPVTDIPGDRLDFDTLIQDAVSHSSGRYVYAGLDASLGLDEVTACIESARAQGARGIVIFDYDLIDQGGWLNELSTTVFALPTTLPTYPWRQQ